MQVKLIKRTRYHQKARLIGDMADVDQVTAARWFAAGIAVPPGDPVQVPGVEGTRPEDSDPGENMLDPIPEDTTITKAELAKLALEAGCEALLPKTRKFSMVHIINEQRKRLREGLVQ